MSAIIEAKPKFDSPTLVKNPSLIDEVTDFYDGVSPEQLALMNETSQ